MSDLTFPKFAALYSAMAANFNKPVQETAIAVMYKSLKNLDPHLTAEQFEFAVMQCLVSAKFMPSLSELLRELYEPSTEGAPPLPDIDPLYADEYQRNIFYSAQNVRSKWLVANQHKPDVGVFRTDRVQLIPGVEERLALAAAKTDNPVLDQALAAVVDAIAAVDQHEREMELERRKRRLMQQAKEMTNETP
jgi:hypothetical protein